MGMNLAIVTQTFGASEDQSWLGSSHGTNMGDPITLKASAFATAFPTGVVPSGTILGKITASGLYGPYNGSTDEVQTVTEGGSGLTSFTLTYSGQTTGSIAAAATAATVQAALEALSNIGAGNVLVTGSAGGPYTVTFQGTLADTDNAQMTATPTGGSGTVTVATTTAGGAAGASDGTQTAAGLLLTTHDFSGGQINLPAASWTDSAAALFFHGEVIKARLKQSGAGGYDAAAATALTLIRFV